MTQDNMRLGENDFLWETISEQNRKLIVWGLWFVVWVGLLLGIFYKVFYEYVVIYSALHALAFFFLFNFKVRPFPVQIRFAYLIWVLLGTYVPHMTILMYITTVGLGTNLFLNYCPLARMLYLLPWNREESFSLNLVKRVILTPPVPGLFKPKEQG